MQLPLKKIRRKGVCNTAELCLQYGEAVNAIRRNCGYSTAEVLRRYGEVVDGIRQASLSTPEGTSLKPSKCTSPNPSKRGELLPCGQLGCGIGTCTTQAPLFWRGGEEVFLRGTYPSGLGFIINGFRSSVTTELINNNNNN